jgi:hypothetical protein
MRPIFPQKNDTNFSYLTELYMLVYLVMLDTEGKNLFSLHSIK